MNWPANKSGLVSSPKLTVPVKIVFRHFPLPGHEHARLAAEAAEAAGAQGKFWQMHDLLFAAQPELHAVLAHAGLHHAWLPRLHARAHAGRHALHAGPTRLRAR